MKKVISEKLERGGEKDKKDKKDNEYYSPINNEFHHHDKCPISVNYCNQLAGLIHT